MQMTAARGKCMLIILIKTLSDMISFLFAIPGFILSAIALAIAGLIESSGPYFSWPMFWLSLKESSLPVSASAILMGICATMRFIKPTEKYLSIEACLAYILGSVIFSGNISGNYMLHDAIENITSIQIAIGTIFCFFLSEKFATNLGVSNLK
ncbi:hypothetical protein [Microvirgula sp. AG722]|uniref:hypothetical protein n=1 Tax=Microvirgula sp. AG722 TaxID=2183901 RepID=UPI0011BF5625|nr:hypothetical protein [Microvirgula sp. AG722]